MILEPNTTNSQCVSPHRRTQKDLKRNSETSMTSVDVGDKDNLAEPQQDLQLTVHFHECRVEVFESEPIDEEDWENLWYDRYDLEMFQHYSHRAVNDLMRRETFEVLRERFECVYDAMCESQVDFVIPMLGELVGSLSEVYEQMEELQGLEYHVVDAVRYDGNRRRARLLDFVDDIRGGKTNATPTTFALNAIEETRPSQLFAWALALAKSAIVDRSVDPAICSFDGLEEDEYSGDVPLKVMFDDRVTYYDSAVMEKTDCDTRWYSQTELEKIQLDTMRAAEKMMGKKKYAKVVHKKFWRLYQAFCDFEDEKDFYQSLAVIPKMKEFYKEVEEFAALDFFVLRKVREDAEDRRDDIIDLVEKGQFREADLAHIAEAKSRPLRFLARAMGIAKFASEDSSLFEVELEVRAEHEAERQ